MAAWPVVEDLLRVDDKKINTAFRRLRERRAAVGEISTAETPEQEAARIQQELTAAQAAGDIATIISIIASTSSLTVGDYIKKTCGSILFLYYTYVDRLHQRPVDMTDMIDGLLYLDAKGYSIKKTTEKGKQ